MRTAFFAMSAMLALIASEAAAQANPIQALDDCVVNQAKRLEISGEAADVIAVAAIANCSRELTAATPTGGALRNSNEARAQLKDAMRETAIVTVVEARTLARTPPPPPPPKAEPAPAPRRPAARRPATPRPATPAIPAP